MADLCRSTPISFPRLTPSLPRSLESDRDCHRTKRRRVECSHPMIHKGRCLLCERAVDDDHSLPFGFLRPCLRLSHDYADRMREVSTATALGFKKLHLILDLDHTLLHSVRLSDLTPVEEERLMPEAERRTEGGPGGGGDIFLSGSETGKGLITKFRPFVREFLSKANELFELTVYTMGDRVYSSMMTKLLDPDRDYFSDRVITKEDCTLRGRKSLDVVLAKEINVLILDDKETVWPDHAENLIAIEPYYYFSHGMEKRGVQRSLVHDEDERDSALAMALRVLKGIHQRYFDPELGLEGADVRKLVRQMQSRVPDTSGDQAPLEDGR